MTRKTSKVVKACVGVSLVSAAAFYLWQLPSTKPADPVPTTAAAEPEPTPTPVSTPQSAGTRPRAAAMAPIQDNDSVRAEKARLAADGEAVRIALREKRLDALDWAAPRPTPSGSGGPEETKTERSLPVEDKVLQTEKVISRLKDRISKSRQQLSTQFDNTTLVARLERRVTELEQRVQTLRDGPRPEQPGGNAPGSPEAGTQASAPSAPQKAL